MVWDKRTEKAVVRKGDARANGGKSKQGTEDEYKETLWQMPYVLQGVCAAVLE